ncbi:MAG: hypothetical protein WC533_01225 [Candidatus Pacearchaeota archaeon]
MKDNNKIAITILLCSIIMGLIIYITLIYLVLDKENNNIIGGGRDFYGCLTSAGYSWNESVGACIREWEFKSENERRAINLIAAPISSTRLTVVDVTYNGCDGCYTIKFQRNDNQNYMESELISWRTKIDNYIYCTAEDKEDIICTKEYLPVCGWFGEGVKCIDYPCAITFGNKCEACSNKDVTRYSEGICPGNKL